VLVLFDHSRLEPVLVEVADPVVAAVEAHRVEAVQPLHPRRQLRLRRPDDQVEVVGHQRPDDRLPAVAPADLAEQTLPGIAIDGVEHDPAPLHAAHRDVEDRG
jgi:methyl coenzyme M reductase gamma subunit